MGCCHSNNEKKFGNGERAIPHDASIKEAISIYYSNFMSSAYAELEKLKPEASTVTSTVSLSPKTIKEHSFSDDMDLPSGFNQMYMLGELIGIGTTSKCYRIVRRHDNREFACKVIDKRRLASDPTRREIVVRQLKREIQVLKQLNHPLIVKLEDVYETKYEIFITIELMKGGELFDGLIEKGKYSEKNAKNIIKRVTIALDYMHSKGIIHRDIKAENVLFQSQSSNHVKLIDFGFAKILDHFQTTSFLGTSGYLAPEIRMQKPYTSAVDVWALGVLTYLILSGRLPFHPSCDILPQNTSPSASYPLHFPEQQFKRISCEAVDFIKKLLNVDPIRRLTTHEALCHPWLKSESKKRSKTKSFTEQDLLNEKLMEMEELEEDENLNYSSIHFVRSSIDLPSMAKSIFLRTPSTTSTASSNSTTSVSSSTHPVGAPSSPRNGSITPCLKNTHLKPSSLY